MTPSVRNLLRPLPDARSAEQFEALFERPGLRVERIVSQGQSSPPGFWYEQAQDEWVLVLAGSAVLRFEEPARAVPLAVGDSVMLPAGMRHRVESTDAGRPTVWLAIHVDRRDAAPSDDRVLDGQRAAT
ncbi:MAG TPA: cupin domain-containing protein [Burkholderiaceae bacterium]|nr:cupin domain-containing protein [Burkholderiaceae bacterium]